MPLEPSWETALQKYFSLHKLDKIESFLEEERKKGVKVFPPHNEIYQAFWLTPLEEVKVVIVGQDPYHKEGQAHGLAFSVKRNTPLPPSLKNIFKEVSSDIGPVEFQNGFLYNWAKQGVFLYNPVLTVEEGKPHSHKECGWKEFSRAVFEVLSERVTPTVFFFWGKAALELAPLIEKKSKPYFLILKATHPSPLSFKGFLGCKHFSKANDFLQKWGQTPIDWKKELS